MQCFYAKLFGYLFMFIVIELTVVGNNSAPSIENFTKV